MLYHAGVVTTEGNKMNTRKYANRFDTDGAYQPIYLIDDKPSFQQVVLETLFGLVALVAFICFILIVGVL